MSYISEYNTDNDYSENDTRFMNKLSIVKLPNNRLELIDPGINNIYGISVWKI